MATHACSHAYDHYCHYGQMVDYLRMNGIYLLPADENEVIRLVERQSDSKK